MKCVTEELLHALAHAQIKIAVFLVDVLWDDGAAFPQRPIHHLCHDLAEDLSS